MICHHELFLKGTLFCVRHGHNFCVDVPISMMREKRIIRCRCANCNEERWLQLTRPAWQNLMEEIDQGKY